MANLLEALQTEMGQGSKVGREPVTSETFLAWHESRTDEIAEKFDDTIKKVYEILKPQEDSIVAEVYQTLSRSDQLKITELIQSDK